MQPNGPRLIVQPDDGLGPVREFIESAQKSLFVKQFTFTSEDLIEAVIGRRQAGVDVRVMLNAARSGGDRANDETYERFTNAGIAVQWANPKFYVTHEKSIVVDEKAALVATFNLCEKYFTLTRDYGVITDDPHHVAQIVEVFNADWNHVDWVPSVYEGLLWSNSNSRFHMAQFIDTATHRLDVQHPKYVDAVILDHLAAASATRREGARAVRRQARHQRCGRARHLRLAAHVGPVRRQGAQAEEPQGARQAADRRRRTGLVGSMNIDRSAFDLRRELGVEVTEPAVVARLKTVFDEDWELSHQYRAPDPLDPSTHHEDDFPHDHELRHE